MSSYEPLHHKYRPQTFADLVGQEAIATTLSNAIAMERIAPAYLFTGPRGTGKTSSARILAKSLNCLSVDHPTASPCGTCEVCQAIARGSALDVIEIDAASNTGVDNIREIIERAQFAPVQCRYKVYVIDECHMLSVAAFNALLKTLEEPPEKVIFVLATTDPQRVLPTIISRCQRFDYRRIPLDAMVKHLTVIAQKETIKIDSEALTLVAQIANGGLRDAESLLDQLSLLSGRITPEKVWDLVGAVPERDLFTLLKAIQSNHPENLIDACRKLMDRGREPLVVLQNLANSYLNLLIAKTAPQRSDLVAVTANTWEELCREAKQWEIETILSGQQKLKESEVQLKNTTQPRLWLEVTLLGLLPDACRSQVMVEASPLPQQTPTNPQSQSVSSSQEKIEIYPIQKDSERSNPEKETKQSQPINQPQPPADQVSKTATYLETSDLSELWQLVLDKLSPLSGALMRDHGHLISYHETVAIVGIKSQALLKAAKDKLPQIEVAFEAVCGHKVKINLQINSASSTSSNNNKLSQSSSVSPNNIQINDSFRSENIQNNIQDVEKPLTDNQKQENQRATVEQDLNDKPENAPLQSVQDLPEIPEPINASAEQVKRAAEQLAKIFEGEIIHYEQAERLNDFDDDSDVTIVDNQQSSSSVEHQEEIQPIKHEQNSLSDPEERQITQENYPADQATQVREIPALNHQSSKFSQSHHIPPVKGRPEIIEDEEDLEF